MIALIVGEHVRLNDSNFIFINELNQTLLGDCLRENLDHFESLCRSLILVQTLMNCAGGMDERPLNQRSLLCSEDARLGKFWVFSAATEGTFFLGGDLAIVAPKKERGFPRSWLRLFDSVT